MILHIVIYPTGLQQLLPCWSSAPFDLLIIFTCRNLQLRIWHFAKINTNENTLLFHWCSLTNISDMHYIREEIRSNKKNAPATSTLELKVKYWRKYSWFRFITMSESCSHLDSSTLFELCEILARSLLEPGGNFNTADFPIGGVGQWMI